MKTRNLANGWQAKENCPDFKPIYASTFGRVKFPNVHENQTSAVCCLRFSMLVPFYYQLQPVRISGEEVIRVVPLLAALKCNNLMTIN